MADDIIITNLRGGRNGIDSPLEVPENQCVDARNVDWSDGPLGRKRPGSVEVATTGGTDFLDYLASMYRHVPEGNGELAELWAVDSAGTVKRLAGGSTWADVTLDEPILDNFQKVNFCSLNGKLFIAYNSGTDRLHVYDPDLDLVRVVGLAAPTNAPTVANTGAGTYAATLRYYRVRAIQWDGVTVIRRSEPSAVVSFTPSGAGTAARITQPTQMPDEHETHWEVEVSLDNAIWFVLAGVEGLDDPIAIATTTYDDDTPTDDYLDLETSEEVGLYDLPPAAKYLTTDGNRLIMAGSWEAPSLASLGGEQSRIWFTAVLGALDHGDDERVINTDAIKGWVDLNEKDGGDITGLSLPIHGIIYAFKYEHVWKGAPTGDPEAPYIFRNITRAVGCIEHKTIVLVENTEGSPVVAFLSRLGAYRVSVNGGLEYMMRDMEDVWYGSNNFPTKMNLHASLMPAHGLYYADLRQIWWYIAVTDMETGIGMDSPEMKLMVDVRCQTIRDEFGVRGGWARHDGQSCKAVCAAQFANTLGASMSLDLKPYIGFREPEED
jgi:hypothetical protein